MIGPVGSAFGGAGQAIAAPAAAKDAGSAFDSVLAQVAGSLRTTLEGAETAAVGGIEGRIPVQDVVHSLLAAERSLQTAIAFRDKTVAAYLDLTRMQI